MIVGIAIGAFGTLTLTYIVASIYAYRSRIKEEREREEKSIQDRWEYYARTFDKIETDRWKASARMDKLETRLSKLESTCYDEGKGDEK